MYTTLPRARRCTPTTLRLLLSVFSFGLFTFSRPGPSPSPASLGSDGTRRSSCVSPAYWWPCSPALCMYTCILKWKNPETFLHDPAECISSRKHKCSDLAKGPCLFRSAPCPFLEQACWTGWWSHYSTASSLRNCRQQIQTMKRSCQSILLWTIIWVTPHTTIHGSGSKRAQSTWRHTGMRNVWQARQNLTSKRSSQRHRAQEGFIPRQDSQRQAHGLQWQVSRPLSDAGRKRNFTAQLPAKFATTAQSWWRAVNWG